MGDVLAVLASAALLAVAVGSLARACLRGLGDAIAALAIFIALFAGWGGPLGIAVELFMHEHELVPSGVGSLGTVLGSNLAAVAIVAALACLAAALGRTVWHRLSGEGR